MNDNLTEIANLPDDIERKVLKFVFLENHQSFKYFEIYRNGIPRFSDIKNSITFKGFAVLPIEGNTDIDINNKKSDAGSYIDNSFNFSIELQDDSDILAIEKYRNKKGVLIIETSLYQYMIGNYDEPLSYTYKETTSTIKVSCFGDTRFKPLRKKISPF